MTMTTQYDETAPESSTLPPGTYRATAQSYAWDTDRAGNPCIKIMFALTDGRPGYQVDGTLYLDEDKPDTKGRTALDRSMEALRAMGLEGELVEDLSAIVGGTAEIVTIIKDNGYAAAKFINAPRSARDLHTFAPPAAPELAGFLARINAQRKSLAGKAAASGATTARTAPQPAGMTPRNVMQPPARPQAPPQQRAPQRQAAPVAQRNEFTSQGADDDIPF